MSRGLVLVEDAESGADLLERARAFAAGEGTDLVVLVLATQAEYEATAETLDAIGRLEHTTYNEEAVLDGLSSDVDDVAADVFGDTVGYDLHVEVTDENQAERVMAVADRIGCDHVFLSGRRRSPAGKALFGDRTQRIILGFDGYVTVAME